MVRVGLLFGEKRQSIVWNILVALSLLWTDLPCSWSRCDSGRNLKDINERITNQNTWKLRDQEKQLWEYYKLNKKNCTYFAFLLKALTNFDRFHILKSRPDSSPPSCCFIKHGLNTVSTAVCKWSVLLCWSCFCTLPATSCMLKKKKKTWKKIKHCHVVPLYECFFFFYCRWLFIFC